ncbi:MAG: hypothetical protein H8F28_27440 [Fibrella sp.]|nr:hypothetical protein [Armatimonadota bacterium]
MDKHLDLSNDRSVTELPENLTVTRLTVRGCWNLKRLPEGLKAFTVDASDSGLVEIPADVQIENALNLSGCADLVTLPENLRVGTLNLSGCTKLAALPEGLRADFLDISDCVSLTSFPQNAQIGVGRLVVRNALWMKTLPPYLKRVAQLDLTGCTHLDRLPDGLEVGSWVDLTGTAVATLPDSMRKTRLRWRGVLVDERIVFRPETIHGKEVLATANAEVRRVMLERIGMERFLADVEPSVLHRDRDPGGERELLRVPMRDDEDLVCLSVRCPSTERHYLLRVPPTMTRCHQAAAWIAGFDDARAYAPLAET